MRAQAAPMRTASRMIVSRWAPVSRSTARSGGKPDQVLEDASGRRPHLMHEGHGQPIAAVPARGRLLAYVGPARIDAEAFSVARRPVRHLALAAHQDRRPRRRDEDDDPGSLADIVPRPGYFASRARAYPAPPPLTNGPWPPERRTPPVNPHTITTPLWLTAGEEALQPQTRK